MCFLVAYLVSFSACTYAYVYISKHCTVGQFDDLLVSLQESSPNKFEDTDSILEMSRKSLSRYHGKILYGLNTLGPIVTLEVLFYLSTKYFFFFLKGYNVHLALCYILFIDTD